MVKGILQQEEQGRKHKKYNLSTIFAAMVQKTYFTNKISALNSIKQMIHKTVKKIMVSLMAGSSG